MNKQRSKFCGLPCIAVIEDTDTSVLGLAILEKSGKLDGVSTVHVVCHFDSMAAEYDDRARGWAGIISSLSYSMGLGTNLLPPELQNGERVL